MTPPAIYIRDLRKVYNVSQQEAGARAALLGDDLDVLLEVERALSIQRE